MDGIFQTLQKMIATGPSYFLSHKFIMVAWIILALITIAVIVRDFLSRIKTIDQQKMILLINRDACVVVDIRNDVDFYAGHIGNSIHINLSDIKDGVLKPIEKYKESTLVLVNKDGLGYQATALQLVKHGFKNMYGLRDGISGWVNSNLPLTTKN